MSELHEAQALAAAEAEKCRVCGRRTLEDSSYCATHNDRVGFRQGRVWFRRLDVVLVLALAIGAWGYPRIKGRVMGGVADYLEHANDSHDPGYLDQVNKFLSSRIPQEAARDKDTKRVAAALRSTLTGGNGAPAPPAEVTEVRRDAEVSETDAGLDGDIDRMQKMTAAQHMGLTQSQLARLQTVKGGALPVKTDIDAAPLSTGLDPSLAPVPSSEVRRGALGFCGNGVIEPGEECDGPALGGATCARLGFSGDCGQEDLCMHPGLACRSNCTFDYAGCTAESQTPVQRFIDHGNGTATDRLTGLMWELKCPDLTCPERHNVLATLPWRRAAVEWVDALNEERFADHNDWRLPSLDELRTLLAAVPPCPSEPCAGSVWPRNQTAAAAYWSTTTFAIDKHRAWVVSFRDGDAYAAEKGEPLHMRAVRDGF